MEGTRHPHPAVQPMSPWQQQQYQQSGQQFQQPRSGQQFQQPRLGQQYQQPRFQPQYQQSEFRQQHQSGLSQHFQQSELVPLHQEISLSQFHQLAGFGQQHQQSRLTQSRSSEQFPHIYPQLPKPQQSQHNYDDKQHDYQSHQASVSGQQQPLSPIPQQQKEAEIMSLLKELNKNSHIQIHPLDMHRDEEITSPASLSEGMSAFSPNSRKETEPNKELQSQVRQTETSVNARVGLHCPPSVHQASVEGVSSTDDGNMAAVKVSMEKNLMHLPPSPSDSPSKLLCSKTSHAPASHDLPRYDFTNITRPNRGLADPSEGQRGAAVSNDCSPSVETTLKNSNPSIDHSETTFRSSTSPSDERLNSVVRGGSNSCGNHLNRVDGDDSNSSDGQLSCALRDDANPLDEQLDSVVHDDSNLSLNHLESVDQSDCSPSDDHIDTALRDDSNPSVDQLEKALHDDSIPSVGPLDSAVCDDSNPSVDQLESTLCTDSSYPVGPSKDQSGSALGDFNPTDSHTGSALCGDASPSDHQQVPELCDYSNQSSNKPESTVPENLRFSISSRKNKSDNEFLNSNSPADHVKTSAENESRFVTGSSKAQSRSTVTDDAIPSCQTEDAVRISSSPSVSHPRCTKEDDSCQLDNKQRTETLANSDSFDAQPETTVQDDFNASGESISNSSNLQPTTTLPNYSTPSGVTLVDDSNSSDKPDRTNDKPVRTSQDDSYPSNAAPAIKFPDDSTPSDSSSKTPLQVNSKSSNTQLRTAIRNDSTLSDDEPRISSQDNSNPLDSPPVTMLQDSNSSDTQAGTALQNNSTSSNDQPGTDLAKAKPLGSQTGTSVHNYSSKSDSQPKTAPHNSDPSGSKVGTSFSNSHPSNDKSETASQGKPISPDTQKRPSLRESRLSDFRSGNAARMHSNPSGDWPGIVSKVNPSLSAEPSKEHEESAVISGVSHPSNPTNSESDPVLPVTLSSGCDSKDGQPESVIEKDSGIQMLDKISEPGSSVATRAGDTNPVPVSVPENRSNSDVICSGASPAKDDCFHFVEIKGTPVSVPARGFADPLPADPFESQDIKPTRSELLSEALRFKESNIHTNKNDDVLEVHSDLHNIHGIHTSNSADFERMPAGSDVEEVSIDQERDLQLVSSEDHLSNDSEPTHFFEENTVYVCEKPVSAVCHVCETNVDSSRYKYHLFFGHLQCGHCNRRLVGCDMLQDMMDSKKSVCKKSDSQEHSFKDWTLDPIEFLSYYIRKELVIKRFCASLSGPPTVSEIVDEIDAYVAKLSSLATCSPWKTAIAKCHKYVTERKAGAKGKDGSNKKTIVSVGYPVSKGKCTIKPFFMTGGHTSAKESSTIKPVTPPIQSCAALNAQRIIEPLGRPSSQCQSAVAPAGQLKVTGLEKVRQPTEALALDEPGLAVASTSKCGSIPGETSGRNFSAKETSQSGNKSRQSGALLLKYLSAGLNKKGKYSKASPKTADDGKKQSNLIKVPHLKNTFVKAPADGNYLVVYYPSQPCPENCPNCYCRFDASKVTVNCITSVITNKCVECALTIYILQDPPMDSSQIVRLPNKRKGTPYKFTGPESKKSRRK